MWRLDLGLVQTFERLELETFWLWRLQIGQREKIARERNRQGEAREERWLGLMSHSRQWWQLAVLSQPWRLTCEFKREADLWVQREKLHN